MTSEDRRTKEPAVPRDFCNMLQEPRAILKMHRNESLPFRWTWPGYGERSSGSTLKSSYQPDFMRAKKKYHIRIR